MSGAVELTAAWWMEPTGTGRVRRMRGEVLNLDPATAARLVGLGAAKRAGALPAPEPAPDSEPRKAPSRRKAPAKAADPSKD